MPAGFTIFPDTMAKSNPVYRVKFQQQGQVYEIYAREIVHGEMFGFIEVADFVFGERSSVVVDPSEEKLKTEFANVSRIFVPMHAVIRIDEVTRQGVAKISKAEGNIMPFPQAWYSQPDSEQS